MATIPLACPECEKTIKVSDDVLGKKIRCKGCGHVFVAKAPAAQKNAKKGEKVEAGPARSGAGGQVEEDANPYGMTDIRLKARCPFCAKEFRDEDDVICLHCGYNTLTRQRHGTTMTSERSAKDWILWLLPAICCLLFIVSCVGVDVLYIAFLGIYIDMKILGFSEAGWLFSSKMFFFWIPVVSFLFIFLAARFAFKRLVLNFTPPEKEMRMKKKDVG